MSGNVITQYYHAMLRQQIAHCCLKHGWPMAVTAAMCERLTA